MKMRERHAVYRLSFLLACVAVVYPVARIAMGRFGVLECLILFWGVYWLWLRPAINLAFLSSRYKSRWKDNVEDQMRFSDEGIESCNEHGEGRSNWSGIRKCVETREGFILIPPSDIFLWIPFVALDGESDTQKLRELLQRNVPDFEKMR
jgi:hypothetical protein